MKVHERQMASMSDEDGVTLARPAG